MTKAIETLAGADATAFQDAIRPQVVAVLATEGYLDIADDAEAARDAAAGSATSAAGSAAGAATDRAAVATDKAAVATDRAAVATDKAAVATDRAAVAADKTDTATNAGVATTAAAAASLGGIAASFTIPGFITNAGVVDAATQAGSWVCSDHVDLDIVSIADLYLYGDTNKASVAYFTKDRAFISGVYAASTGAYVSAMGARPANARFARFSAHVPAAGQRFVAVPVVAKLPNAQVNANVFTGDLFSLLKNRGFPSTANPPVYSQDVNWQYSDLIAVTPGSYIDYDVWAAAGMSILTYWDASRAFINTGRVDGSGAGSRFIGSAQIPAGVGFVQLCGANPNVMGAASGAANTIRYRPDPLTTLVMPATAEIPVGNLWIYMTLPGYISTTGAIGSSTDTNWMRSNHIPVKPGRNVRYDAVGTSAMNIVSFFDAAGTFISGVPGLAGNLRSTGTVKIPDNTATMKICGGNIDKAGGALGWAQSAFSTTFRCTAQAPVASPVIAYTDTVILYGDSRMSNDYAFNKARFADRLGCTVLNNGLSGHTVAQNASDADLASVFAAAAVGRAVIFLPGGNDNGAAGTIGTFAASSVNGVGGEAVVAPIALATATPAGYKFVQYVDLTVQKILAQYKNIRSRAALTGSETEAQKNDKIRAVVKPILVLVTDLPQQRSADATFGLAANWERKRQAILEVAAYRKVRCVDFQARWPIDMTIEPSWTNPTDKVTNNGVWFMDGLHPNEFLFDELACMVAGDLGITA